MTKMDDNFFQKVYAVVKQVPKGRVTSYGAIAEYLGSRISSRMVGWAMHACPLNVPAHRVLNRNGMLTGKQHFATPTLMQELLEAEKVKVENDKVKDLKKIYWDPNVELGIKSLESGGKNSSKKSAVGSIQSTKKKKDERGKKSAIGSVQSIKKKKAKKNKKANGQ
jgi:methylated-DNA-protein-cysteine methyltransferase related protein